MDSKVLSRYAAIWRGPSEVGGEAVIGILGGIIWGAFAASLRAVKQTSPVNPADMGGGPRLLTAPAGA